MQRSRRHTPSLTATSPTDSDLSPSSRRIGFLLSSVTESEAPSHSLPTTPLALGVMLFRVLCRIAAYFEGKESERKLVDALDAKWFSCFLYPEVNSFIIDAALRLLVIMLVRNPRFATKFVSSKGFNMLFSLLPLCSPSAHSYLSMLAMLIGSVPPSLQSDLLAPISIFPSSFKSPAAVPSQSIDLLSDPLSASFSPLNLSNDLSSISPEAPSLPLDLDTLDQQFPTVAVCVSALLLNFRSFSTL